MRRRALWIAVVVGCICGGFLVYRQGRIERAQALCQRAARLLHAPFDEAPAFSDVRAAEARMLLDEADLLAATSDGRRLRIEADALIALQRGDAATARKALAGANVQDSSGTGALRAAIELADGKLAAADGVIAKVVETAPDPRAFAIASEIARAKGQGDRALAYAQKGLEQKQSAALLEARGLAYELLGDLAHARSDYELAAQLDARPAGPLLHLGRVLREQGDVRGAVLAFNGATQRNPRDSEAWLGTGICRIGLQDYSGARADLERAGELAPTKAAPLIGLGDVDAAQKQWEAAEHHYRAATMLEPKSALAWLKLGNTSMRRGQLSAATDAYRKAIDNQPELAAAHNGLGAALQATGESDAAKSELEQAAKLDPNDPNPFFNLARLYRQQGNDSAAETALAQAQSKSPAQR